MKKILMVIGLVRPWAISNRANALARHLANDYDVTVVPQNQLPPNPADYDIIHLHTSCSLPIIGHVPGYANHPCWGFEIVSVRSNAHIEALSYVRNAAFCVAKNPRLAEYARQYVSSDCQIVYEPNGVNERLFFPRPIRIGWCGNHRPDSLEYKGVGLIRAAVEQLQTEWGKYVEIEFVMDPGDCPKRILSQTEIAHWYRTLDVYAQASLGEGCSNTILEALASGVPVVTTDTGIAQELSDDGCGIQVVDRTVERLKAGIEAILFERLVCRKAIFDKYRWKVLWQQYAELYGGLLK